MIKWLLIVWLASSVSACSYSDASGKIGGGSLKVGGSIGISSGIEF